VLASARSISSRTHWSASNSGCPATPGELRLVHRHQLDQALAMHAGAGPERLLALDLDDRDRQWWDEVLDDLHAT
jgi:hypothetical protein